jgi:hypothetical protein
MSLNPLAAGPISSGNPVLNQTLITSMNIIQIKRSTTAGNTPTLLAGELGVNLADGIFWIGNGTTNVQFGAQSLFVSQPAAHFLASPAGAAGVMTSRLIAPSDLGTGTASSTTVLYGNGTWAPVAATSIAIGAGITGSTANSVLFAGSGGLLAQDNVHFNYNVTTFTLTATNLAGAGAGITNLNASNLATGIVATALLGSGTASNTTYLRGDNTWQVISSPLVPGLGITIVSNVVAIDTTWPGQSAINTVGTITAGIWKGTTINSAHGGTGLIGVTAGDLMYGSGTNIWSNLAKGPAAYLLQMDSAGNFPIWTNTLNASNLTSGMVPSARLGTGTADATTTLHGDGTWAPSSAASISIGSGVINGTANSVLFVDSSVSLAQDNAHFNYNATTFTLTATNLAGAGAALTNLNANNITSGTVGISHLGTGVANNTTFLRGDNTWQTVSATVTLTGDVTGSGTGTIATSVKNINGAVLGSTTTTAGNLLIGSGTIWVSQPITGDVRLAAGGAMTVTGLNGVVLGSTVATAGNLLVGSGSNWVSTPVSGDGTLSSTGHLTVTGLNGVVLGSTVATSGNLLIGSGSNWVSTPVSGDGILTSAGLLRVTRTNNVLFAPSATIDTTNANNISSGTLPVAQMAVAGLTINQCISTTFTDVDGATVTFNLAANNWHKVTLGGNRTLAVTGGVIDQTFYVKVIQAASGGPWVPTWFGGITWYTQNFSQPAMPVTPSAGMICSFRVTGANSYDGFWCGSSAS